MQLKVGRAAFLLCAQARDLRKFYNERNREGWLSVNAPQSVPCTSLIFVTRMARALYTLIELFANVFDCTACYVSSAIPGVSSGKLRNH
jgi:hypothetical protein